MLYTAIKSGLFGVIQILLKLKSAEKVPTFGKKSEKKPADRDLFCIVGNGVLHI
jgi:hypothetical protein